MDDYPKEKKPAEGGAQIDIFTVLSHDLKSPLNAVEAYMDIMHNKILGENIEAYMPILNNCFARLHQMRELITDVVDFSRLRYSSMPRPLTIIDVSKTARIIIDAYSKEAQARNITISVDIEDSLTITAGDREIDLILRHLIDNAIKYNKEGGTVIVTIRKSGPFIKMNVSDTGIGMTAKDQQRLFQEFVRIKNKKTQDIRGTGLGLAIVKKLLELYQGAVSVTSEPDKGTTFSIVFSAGTEQKSTE